MYCMPQKGTKTSLYIGNGDEAQGIATGCIRTNGSICEGTTIESNGGLVLMAKEGIRLESNISSVDLPLFFVNKLVFFFFCASFNSFKATLFL